jgi:hypothetical protein
MNYCPGIIKKPGDTIIQRKYLRVRTGIGKSVGTGKNSMLDPEADEIDDQTDT